MLWVSRMVRAVDCPNASSTRRASQKKVQRLCGVPEHHEPAWKQLYITSEACTGRLAVTHLPCTRIRAQLRASLWSQTQSTLQGRTDGRPLARLVLRQRDRNRVCGT